MMGLDVGDAVSTAFVGLFMIVVVFSRRFRKHKLSKSAPWSSEHIPVADGGLRAAVFGFSDGVVSNVCLILGVYISVCQEATESIVKTRSVVISGLAGLLAGACSMACGEWISMVVQKQGLEQEIRTERAHLTHYKKQEKKLLKVALEKHGISPNVAEAVIADLSTKGVEKLLPFHAQMVLGIDMEDLGSPWNAALSSFLCFAIGALTPVIPWIFIEDHKRAFAWTLVMVSAAVFAAGGIISMFSHRSALWVSMRQLLVVCVSVMFSMVSSYVLIGSVV
ncbi:hypothetical protein AAMO2058_001120700 [Amorphochlora amoebiformis]